MKLNKLVLSGESYQRTINFSDGLTIISGEKTSGKSLILLLIDYCLGKSKLKSMKVQTELKDHVDSLFLEIMINNITYTISRSIKVNINTFWVYHSSFSELSEFIPEKLDKKGFLSFLMNRIGVTEFKKTKNKPKSNELQTETISFRELYRYCYIHQDELGTSMFLSDNVHMKKYKNPISFEMMFDLVDFSQNDVQTEIVKVQNKIREIQTNVNNLHGYLHQRGNDDFNDLILRIDDYDKNISRLEKRKNQIVHEQNKENEITKSNKDFVLLTTDIHDLDNENQRMTQNVVQIKLGIQSNQILLSDYHLEMKELQTTEEINYKLRIEAHKLTCPLCKSKIKNDFDSSHMKQETEKNFKTVLKEIQNKINMVNEVMNTNRIEIDEIELKIKTNDRKKEILTLALFELSKDIKTPFLPQLNSININITNLEKDREILLESKRVHNKITQLMNDIEEEENNLDALKAKLKTMEENGTKKDKILESLNKSYFSNMENMKYADLGGTYIDENKYIPHYQDSSVFEHSSGGLLVCMQLSYLDAIVSSNFSKYHPKLLLLDSVSKYFGTLEYTQKVEGVKEELEGTELDIENEVEDIEKINDPEVYLNVFKMLVRLSETAQVIVVENTPPIEMREYVEFIFKNGMHGLIDLDENEF